MSSRTFRVWSILAVSVMVLLAMWWKSPTGAPPSHPDTPHIYRELQWKELVPQGWDPLKRFRGIPLTEMNDSDPRVAELQRQMREAWDNAPTVYRMDGVNAKLSGYVVPLEVSSGNLKEFLLVPYFGACIHTPPPPANQIVHVVLSQPVKGIHTMDAVLVSGVLRTARKVSLMGMSGYAMDTAFVEPYLPPLK
jgi:hypothetical protein